MVVAWTLGSGVSLLMHGTAADTAGCSVWGSQSPLVSGTGSQGGWLCDFVVLGAGVSRLVGIARAQGFPVLVPAY